MGLLAAIGQAIDYIFKAAKAYAATPEGAKELADVIAALEGDYSPSAQSSAVSGSTPASKSYRG